MSKCFKDDLTGKTFGELTVVKFVPTDNRRSYWLCKCSCGGEAIVYSGHLKCGHTTTCNNSSHRIGKKCSDDTKQKISNANTKHSGCGERLYRVWASMLNRCNNQNEIAYKWYGAKGIKVCDEWLDYANFRQWALSSGYDENAEAHACSIDRIDGNGDYCPENCRWANAKTQANNRKSNVLLTYNGKTQTMMQWSEETGVPYGLIQQRLNRGWGVQKAIEQPCTHK